MKHTQYYILYALHVKRPARRFNTEFLVTLPLGDMIVIITTILQFCCARFCWWWCRPDDDNDVTKLKRESIRDFCYECSNLRLSCTPFASLFYLMNLFASLQSQCTKVNCYIILQSSFTWPGCVQSSPQWGCLELHCMSSTRYC